MNIQTMAIIGLAVYLLTRKNKGHHVETEDPTGIFEDRPHAAGMLEIYNPDAEVVKKKIAAVAPGNLGKIKTW